MLPQKYWDKVQVNKNDECWPWLACLCGGYGHIHMRGKVLKAHRLSYEEHKGAIPPDKIVMHLCDNRACVNPAHLVLGSILDNNHDRDNKRRQVAKKGEDHGNAKLTKAGAAEIKALQRKQSAERNELANRLGVTPQAVYDVMRGKTWLEVE